MGSIMLEAYRNYWACRPDVPLVQPVGLEELALNGATTVLVHHAPASPTGRPVLVLHGIESHPLWFVSSADALATRGHDVYGLQRRGSGLTKQDRGHAHSPAQLLSDLEAAVKYVLAQTKSDRLQLVGISWGGKLAACYALNPARAAALAGLTLIAPGVAPNVDLHWKQKLLVALCALAAPQEEFSVPLEDPSLFTENPARQAYIRKDPYRLHTVTARFLATSRLLDRQLAVAPAGSLTMPVHLILAERDRIIDNLHTRAIIERLAGDGLHIHELAGSHTLEFERDPAAFYETLAGTLA